MLIFTAYNFSFAIAPKVDITPGIILLEYDHIEGKFFIDHIASLKRKLLKGKLNDISKRKLKTLVAKKQALIKMALPSQEDGQTKEKTKSLENKN